jgi:dTDP-4-amino-4,6-dideoxygalactose transaminase
MVPEGIIMNFGEAVNTVDNQSVRHRTPSAAKTALNDHQIQPVGPVPFNRIFLTGEERSSIAAVCEGGNAATDGRSTARAIEVLKSKLGLRHVLLTPSCTLALEAMPRVLGIGHGDEVIMPSFTFCSTANAFLLAGATPVFVDIRADTLTMDENAIEAAITPKTKAICVVHYAGVCSDLDRIAEVAARHNIPMVEDAAQGVGSYYKDRALGSIGDMGAYSFHHTKNLISGEGGALCINNPIYDDLACNYRDKGTNRRQFFRGEVDKYTWVSPGSSLAMSEIVAAFLAPQLDALGLITALRGAAYNYYVQGLQRLARKGWLTLPVIPNYARSNYHIFHILLESKTTRDRLLEFLRSCGVQATTHFVPLHSAPMGIAHCRVAGALPVTEHSADCMLRLPLFAAISRGEQDKVIQAIQTFFLG